MEEAIPEEQQECQEDKQVLPLCLDELSNSKKKSAQCIICLDEAMADWHRFVDATTTTQGLSIVYTTDVKTLKDSLLIHQDDEVSSSDSNNSSRSLSSERASSVDIKSKRCSHNPTSKGLLHCIWKNGDPYFVFYTLNENKEEVVLVANRSKLNHPYDKVLDCAYSFHSRSSFQKEAGGKNGCSIVGKMEVTSCVTFDSNGSIITESEFVLHGIKEEEHHHHHRRHQRDTTKSYTLNAVKFKGLSNLFKSHHPNPNLKKSILKVGDVDIDFDDFVQESWLDDQLNHTQMDLELAAVVIKDGKSNMKKENIIGGWGLKFLEKPTATAATKHVDPSSLIMGSYKKEEPARSVNVVFPAGIHGGEGPSSLVERWATGGHCDCGGWDIGCPLTVLNNKTRSHNTPSQQDVNLLREGAKPGELPTLRVVIEEEQEGLHVVYFQSNITSLQAFSIGVAILHNQIPDPCSKVLRPKSTTRGSYRRKSETFGRHITK